MSIGFSIHTKTKNINTFRNTLDELAEKFGYQTTHEESSSIVTFCKFGTLYFDYEIKNSLFC